VKRNAVIPKEYNQGNLSHCVDLEEESQIDDVIALIKQAIKFVDDNNC